MRRYILPIVLLVALVFGLVFMKGSQIGTLIHFGETAKKAGPPPETVSTAVATQETWEETLPSVGTVAAAKGVTVSNDAPGVVSAILFESGATVQQGQVLVVLDKSVEQAQLASAEARKELATLNAGRTQTLVQAESLAKSQLDNDNAVVKTSRADLNALAAQIERKIVRAPFAGHLGIRTVNLGQYLNPGTAITTLESMDSVYVDFNLPQQQLAEARVGAPVRVTVDDGDPASKNGSSIIEGAIAAVDPTLDATTRSVKLRASMPNGGGKLRAGMFVPVLVVLPAKKEIVRVPYTAVIHASFGDSVFVVENKQGASPLPNGKPVKQARQQFVRTGEHRGDFVSIENGLHAGEEVVVAGGFKLRNGASVTINNDVDQAPKLDPKPENR